MNNFNAEIFDPTFNKKSKFYENTLPEWEDGAGLIFNAVFWFTKNDLDVEAAHGFGEGPHGPYMWFLKRSPGYNLTIICADRSYIVTPSHANCRVSGPSMVSHTSTLEPFLVEGRIRWADTQHVQVTPMYPLAAPLAISKMYDQFSAAVVGRSRQPGIAFAHEKQVLLELICDETIGGRNVPHNVDETMAQAYVSLRLAGESLVNNGFDEMTLVRQAENFLEVALKFPNVITSSVEEALRPMQSDPVATDNGRVLFPILKVAHVLLANLLSGNRCDEARLTEICEKAKKQVAETKAALKKEKEGQ